MKHLLFCNENILSFTCMCPSIETLASLWMFEVFKIGWFKLWPPGPKPVPMPVSAQLLQTEMNL